MEHVTIVDRTAGDEWNGWGMPFFDRDAADLLTTILARAGVHIRYDSEQDSYVRTPEEQVFDENTDPQEVEQYHGHDVFAPGGRIMRVYPIGTRAWCWEVD